MTKPRILPSLALAAICLSTVLPAAADVAVLVPIQDATLYEDAGGTVANGAGEHLFTGRTAIGDRRRALLLFDVAGEVPAGSTIVAASLTLDVSLVPLSVIPVATGVHRVLAAWGEGASDAPDPEGIPAPAAAGDATWLHTFFPGDLWALEGGDFDPAPSASETVGGLGPVTWGSTPAMVADVQEWLDSPGTNNGWILVVDSDDLQTAKRLDSRENPTPSARPQLTVEFLSVADVEIPTLSAWALALLAALLLAAAVRRLA